MTQYFFVKVDFLGRRVLQMGSGRSGGETKRRVVTANTHFSLIVAIGTSTDFKCIFPIP